MKGDMQECYKGNVQGHSLSDTGKEKWAKKIGKSKQYGRYCKDMAVLHKNENDYQIKCCKQVE